LGQTLQDRIQVQKTVSQDDVEFVQNDQIVATGSECLAGLLPASQSQPLVFFRVGVPPGKAFSQGQPFHGGQPSRGALFSRVPCPLDELQHQHTQIMARGAQGHPQGGRGFSLAVSGKDHHKAAGRHGFSLGLG